MRIHRSNPGKHFTQIPNETLRDERLSYRARGVLCELLSHADGWDTTADRIASAAGGQRWGTGREAMRTVFAELEAAGYLVRARTRRERGRIGTELHLYDRPVSAGGTGTPETRMPVPPVDSDVSAGGTDVRVDRPSADWASNRRPSTNTEEEHGRNDLASRRAAQKRAAPERTVQSVIADVRTAAASVHGKQEANELDDGHALGLYFYYAHGKEVHDLVAYMVKIFGDAPYLDTFTANAGWRCPVCQRGEDGCSCAA